MAAENFLWELWKPLSSGGNQPKAHAEHGEDSAILIIHISQAQMGA